MISRGLAVAGADFDWYMTVSTNMFSISNAGTDAFVVADQATLNTVFSGWIPGRVVFKGVLINDTNFIIILDNHQVAMLNSSTNVVWEFS